MTNQFIGELRMTSFNFAPKGWAMCNGQLLSINQNQALFSLLGTVYGGNGVNTFGLPNLQGRIPVHFDADNALGTAQGTATHAFTANEIPRHTHTVRAATATATAPSPAGNVWANPGSPTFGALSGTTLPMAPDAVSAAGSSIPVSNMPPYLVINWVIAIQGVFPSRN